MTQFLTLFLALASTTILAAPLQSATWPNLFASNYQYPAEISSHPHYVQLATYQDAHSPYLVYNLIRLDGNPTASAVLANGKPGIAYVPNYNYFYGTPIYNYGFPFNPVYPVLRPQHPGLIPNPAIPPTSTTRPIDDDDGIEKLDMQLDPATEMKKPTVGGTSYDDDTITVDAL